ncbi:MAG: transglutaminase-like cysteine peptidase [Candidatus Omnitrophica bacterium]|nr:transglutaminase-like cysteine peptidase [Candidatus Omnitrophota bacterium]
MKRKQLIIAWVTAIILFYPFPSFASARLEVTGIMTGEEPLAIVDGMILKEGDILNGVKVLEIKEEFVRFEQRGKIFIKKIREGCRSSKQLRYKQQFGSKEADYKSGIKKKAFAAMHSEKLYKKALENYKLANDEYEIVNITRAYIYYEKAVKYAQAAIPLLPEAKRNKMVEIVFSSRDKRRELEGEKAKINNLEYACLKSSEEISGWLRNNIVYKPDKEFYPQKDYWQTPKETIILGSGDCEDFAFLAQALLKETGMDPSVIAIQYKEGSEKTGHAICVFPEKGLQNYFSGYRLYKTTKMDILDLVKSLYPECVRIDELNLSRRSAINIFRK